ncbi:putative non-specific serine/threonine protein kinase [Helianthus debilis subsp. tardiflorus]
MFAFNLPFFFLFFSTITTTIQPYKATDRVFLNCGSNSNSNSNSDSDSDKRWEGDEHSKFVPSDIHTTSFSSVPDDLDSSVDDLPYSTARFFRTSPFTYAFPVSSQGPKFLRLHFYPTNYIHHNTYNDLNTEQSFFSVSSNGYSLLTNFSAFFAAAFLAKTHSSAGINIPHVPRVVKEFLIYVKDTQILNVTFTPSRNSLAFINGIEIVSVPENLYFKDKGLKYVGMNNGPVITTTQHLKIFTG